MRQYSHSTTTTANKEQLSLRVELVKGMPASLNVGVSRGEKRGSNLSESVPPLWEVYDRELSLPWKGTPVCFR